MPDSIPKITARLKNIPIDKSRRGPESEYDQLIRDSLLRVPFRAINWDALPLDHMREILRILGEPADPTFGEYNLTRACRRAVFQWQRADGWRLVPPVEDPDGGLVTSISGIQVFEDPAYVPPEPCCSSISSGDRPSEAD